MSDQGPAIGHGDDLIDVDPYPDSVPLCWSCESQINEGEGRNKDGWFVHHLCPVPTPEEVTDGE